MPSYRHVQSSDGDVFMYAGYQSVPKWAGDDASVVPVPPNLRGREYVIPETRCVT